MDFSKSANSHVNDEDLLDWWWMVCKLFAIYVIEYLKLFGGSKPFVAKPWWSGDECAVRVIDDYELSHENYEVLKYYAYSCASKLSLKPLKPKWWEKRREFSVFVSKVLYGKYDSIGKPIFAILELLDSIFMISSIVWLKVYIEAHCFKYLLTLKVSESYSRYQQCFHRNIDYANGSPIFITKIAINDIILKVSSWWESVRP